MSILSIILLVALVIAGSLALYFAFNNIHQRDRNVKLNVENEELGGKFQDLTDELDIILMNNKIGYYKIEYDWTNIYVYVALIQEYNNGDCKVRYLSAECDSGFEESSKKALTYAINSFISIIHKDNVEWLELTTKDARKQKLEQLRNKTKI